MQSIALSDKDHNCVPLAALPPLALDQFMQQSGLSPATCWRYRNRGWLKTIIIAGRHYVTREAIVEFNTRAAAGEFAGTVANPSVRREGARNGEKRAGRA